MRVNKLLSNFGYCSRKEASRLIEEGRVTVNGSVSVPGQWVEEDDCILLDGQPVKPKEKVYLAFNKPPGVTCTAEKTVENNIIDCVGYEGFVFPVGRLDKDSQGLILLTNDGELANRVLESGNGHEKEYVVTVDREFDDSFLQGMAVGVDILGVRTRACRVWRISGDTFGIVLTQGLNRQIRRMAWAFGFKVVRLERIRILGVRIDGIDMGSWRFLTEAEVEDLRGH